MLTGLEFLQVPENLQKIVLKKIRGDPVKIITLYWREFGWATIKLGTLYIQSWSKDGLLGKMEVFRVVILPHYRGQLAWQWDTDACLGNPAYTFLLASAREATMSSCVPAGSLQGRDTTLLRTGIQQGLHYSTRCIQWTWYSTLHTVCSESTAQYTLHKFPTAQSTINMFLIKSIHCT